jgi:hypothetical protein
VSYLFGQDFEKHNRPELLYRKKKGGWAKMGALLFPRGCLKDVLEKVLEVALAYVCLKRD